MPVTSRRIYKWAYETRITGSANAATVNEAATQFRQGGGGMVWLLDASGVSDFSMDAIPAVQDQVIGLHPMGMDRIALVLSDEHMPFAGMINVHSVGVPVFHFRTRAEAIVWMNQGCK